MKKDQTILENSFVKVTVGAIKDLHEVIVSPIKRNKNNNNNNSNNNNNNNYSNNNFNITSMVVSDDELKSLIEDFENKGVLSSINNNNTG